MSGLEYTDAWFEDDKLIMEHKQDVAPILENNKLRRLNTDGYSPTGDTRFVGSIPMVVVEEWMKEGINIFDPNDTPKIIQRLNDGDYAAFRTSEGKL